MQSSLGSAGFRQPEGLGANDQEDETMGQQVPPVRENLFSDFEERLPTHDPRPDVTQAAISPVDMLPKQCTCGRNLAIHVDRLNRMMAYDASHQITADVMNALGLKPCCRGIVIGSQSTIQDVARTHVVSLFD